MSTDNLRIPLQGSIASSAMHIFMISIFVCRNSLDWTYTNSKAIQAVGNVYIANQNILASTALAGCEG